MSPEPGDPAQTTGRCSPRVSVVIPAYNCAAYLPEAIQSVFAQTYPDWEIVVVDDGSTDATEAVVAPFLDRIRYIRQANKGLPGARNTGIRATTGELVALLDADDAWSPDKLALQVPLFNDPAVGIVYSDFSVRYSDGRVLASYLADRPLASEGFVVDQYLRSRFLFPSAMVLRRMAMEQCGLFDEEMFASEDIELFARICLRWKVARVNQPLMLRTEGTHNITSNGSKMNDYTILALEKIAARASPLPASTQRVLQQELGLQHWWRGYARFHAGRTDESRRDLWRAMRYDPKHLRAGAVLLAASYLPAILLQRVRSSRSSSPSAM